MPDRPKSNPYPGRREGETWYCGCNNQKEVALHEKIEVDDGKLEERMLFCHTLRPNSQLR
jgi:hypothetical protein